MIGDDDVVDRQAGRGDAAERNRRRDRQRAFDLRSRRDHRLCQSVRRRQGSSSARTIAAPTADLAPRKRQPQPGRQGRIERRTARPRTASAAASGARAIKRDRPDRAQGRREVGQRSQVAAMTANSRHLSAAMSRSHERLRTVHPPADRDLAARDRAADRRRARLLGAAGVGAAAGRFPDRAGDDATAGRQPRRDRVADHGAAGASARADPVAVVDAVDQFVRRQPDLAAVRSQPRHRRRHPGRAGRDQRRRRHPAEEPAVPADLRQGESGRRAGA